MNLKLKVSDLDCIDCARALEHVARRTEGVQAARVSVALSTLELTLADGADRKAVLRALARKGYELVPVGAPPAGRARSTRGVVSRRRLILTSACGALLAAALAASLLGAPPGLVIVLFAASSAAGLPLCLLRAINAVRSRAIDMNVLMTIAIAAAMAIQQWGEAATVAFLFSIANILEALAMARTRRAIEALVELSPDLAMVRRDGELSSVEAASVRIGESIVIKPGERIPLEGRVLSGSTSVDESPITGESRPVEKQPGAEVFAGTLNEEGLIEVVVTKPKEESTLARIIHLVEHIAETKAPIERFVDRFAAVYTPVVVVGAVAVAVVPWLAGASDGWVHRSLVLLIIACPCALVIATPVAIVSGLTSAARRGILIKGGVHLEEAARIRAVAFDKTGTLTVGRPKVRSVQAVGAVSERDLVAIAAAVESASTHPLAGAVLAEARRRGIHWDQSGEVRSMTGTGISAVVKGTRYFVAKPAFFGERLGEAAGAQLGSGQATAVVVGTETEVLGAIRFADEARPGAREALEQLRRLGITRTVMITGDSEEAAREVAQGLGIDQYHANLLPQEKVEIVRALSASRGHVAMVGDGVNDAPALAAADLGIAMGAAGSDAAIETADAALMSDDIGRLVQMFGISRKVRSITRQNIAFALAVKAIFLSLAVNGNATMWMAVFADMGASLIVIANALRLLSERAMGLRGWPA